MALCLRHGELAPRTLAGVGVPSAAARRSPMVAAGCAGSGVANMNCFVMGARHALQQKRTVTVPLACSAESGFKELAG
jgi:hypothetical protein